MFVSFSDFFSEVFVAVTATRLATEMLNLLRWGSFQELLID